jgi:hypothetical protein
LFEISFTTTSLRIAPLTVSKSKAIGGQILTFDREQLAPLLLSQEIVCFSLEWIFHLDAPILSYIRTNGCSLVRVSGQANLFPLGGRIQI